MHNPKFTLSMANFRALRVFPPASSGKFLFTSANTKFFFESHFDKPKNSLEFPNSTRNVRKCSNKLMTNTFGEINSQSKQDINVSHIAKVKSATSAHYLAHVISFLAYVMFPLNPTFR